MIVTSIHDPAIFAPERLTANGYYLGLLMERLRIAANCHLIAIDETNSGGSIMMYAIQQAGSQNPTIGMLLSSVFKLERCVRLPAETTRVAKIQELIKTAGSAQAVALAGCSGVDVCILDDETFTAAEMQAINRAKLTTLADYHKTEAYQRENLAFGGKPVSDLTKEEFLQKIVRPVVFWADQVTIIDKMIGRAAFGADNHANTDGKPSNNWSHFNTTLHEIFKLWDKGPNSKGRRFRIITESVTNVMPNGCLCQGPALAAELAGRLTIPPGRVEVILKSADQVKSINHDRYLLTNHGFVVGITKGFDLLQNDSKCGVSDVYLRQAQSQNDILAQLCNSTRGTVGCYPEKMKAV